MPGSRPQDADASLHPCQARLLLRCDPEARYPDVDAPLECWYDTCMNSHVSQLSMGRGAAGVEARAELLKALAHPIRLGLLEELVREEECVCHLSALFGRPQPYISQQLAELRDAGLVVDRRDGQRVFYRAADPRVAALLNAVRELTGDSDRPQGLRQPLPGCPCPKCGQQ